MGNFARGYYPQKPPLGSMIDWGHPLANGLLGWWLLNEGAGTNLANLTRRAGTDASSAAGLATWSNGRFGPCLAFASASSQYATIPDNAAWNFTSFTLSAWFRTSTTGAFQDILRRDDGISNRNWLLRVDNANHLSFVAIYGGIPNAASAATVTDGLWHHACATAQASGGNTNFTLYLDASSVATSTATATNPAVTQTIEIGRFFNPSSEFFDGRIDQPSIWNRCLSAADVQQLYSQPFSPIATPNSRRFFFVPSTGVKFRRNLNRRTGSRSPVSA